MAIRGRQATLVMRGRLAILVMGRRQATIVIIWRQAKKDTIIGAQTEDYEDSTNINSEQRKASESHERSGYNLFHSIYFVSRAALTFAPMRGFTVVMVLLEGLSLIHI